ncbi:hypothetical protein IHE45_18G119400 [Dioscorea alata]|uniref:Uncharacterized protein n=1 Tax=Dioscorea alata TaxID=55571 RepID=A0ACB7U9U9_DIOAL|nr:hypothetical protein IHE45_18G119400 [Dioscorea alata]
MVTSEITEEDDDEYSCWYQMKMVEVELQKTRIREIIAYQKYMYRMSASLQSSSSVSSSASFSASEGSFSSSIGRSSSSLTELMKARGNSLQRLFSMDKNMPFASDYDSMFQTGIPIHFDQDLCDHHLDVSAAAYRYLTSLSFLESIRTSEERVTIAGGPIDLTSWSPIRPFRISHNSEAPAFRRGFFRNGWLHSVRKHLLTSRRRRLLKKSSSFMALPATRLARWRWRGGFSKWTWIGFRFCLRLRRLRILVCRKKF